MTAPIVNRVTLRSGGATSPTVELYQRASGRCRLWCYCFDQDGMEQHTIATFSEKGWAKAVEKGRALYQQLVAEAVGRMPPREANTAELAGEARPGRRHPLLGER
jgi:hypothetical protein